MLDQGEWPLFAAHLYARPWRVFSYGLALLLLVGRRLAQSLQIRVQHDPHSGLKQRPSWLWAATDTGLQINSLRFPHLELDGEMPEIPLPALRADDPEAYFARHRWANCAMALGNEERARMAFSAVKTWIAQPPPRVDAAWESYSCCERIVNLALLLAAHPSLRREADEAQLKAFFEESAAWVDAHLEYYGTVRTNNHFLNNGRALVVAGCILGNNAWLSTGLAITELFAPELFPIDGCLREGSSHYQLIVAGWLFDILLFAPLAMQPIRLATLEALARKVGGVCSRFAATLPNMDQHIGDISPDLHPQLTLARLHCLYGTRLNKLMTGASLGEWLFTERGRSALIAHAVRKWPQSHTTHSHPDLGSFIWLYSGHAILVDPGRQDYIKRAQTKAQLSPAAHNVLLINGIGPLASSVIRSGIWHPQPYSNVLTEVATNSDGFSLLHDGFTRIPGVGKHRRKVCLTDDGIEIVDTLDGTGIFELSLFWHFSPEWHEETDRLLISTIGRLFISLESSKELSCAWSDFDLSAAYGEATKSRCLSFVEMLELPCIIHTKMNLEPCVE